MIEIWKDVVGYEGYYAVSDRGRIKRVAAGQGAIPGKILTCWPHRNGYRMVTLSVDGVRFSPTVHSLVAKAFLGNRETNQQVNHKNGDKTDNRVTNLEWMTPLENTRHAWDELGIDLRGENSATSKLTEDEVQQIRCLYGTGNCSQSALARQYSVSVQQVSNILHRKSWAHLPELPEEKQFDGFFATRLTPSDVQQIRTLYASGDYTMEQVGAMFGIDSSHVCRIVHRQIWKDVPDLDASPEVRKLRNRQATQGPVR